MTAVYRMGWSEVYRRLTGAPQGFLYGVPRGGSIVAGLTGRAVDSADEAAAIVDDIIDTGDTCRQWRSRVAGKQFWALVDKSPGGPDEKLFKDYWVEFPWEREEAGRVRHEPPV